VVTLVVVHYMADLFVNINAQLEIGKMLEVEQLLKEFKDVFAWTYKNIRGIPP